MNKVQEKKEASARRATAGPPAQVLCPADGSLLGVMTVISEYTLKARLKVI